MPYKTSFARLWMSGFLVLALAALAAGCGRAPETAAPQLVLDGRTMGTYWRVAIVHPPEQLDEAALRVLLESRLEEVNAQMSNYDPDSEISRFNRAEVGAWFPVSAPLAHVMATALEISALSNGAFDVTVGPLVNLWGFGQDRPDEDRVPSEAEITAALAKVDWEQLEVRADPPALRRHADVRVDLGGIAKGHGADVLAETLNEQGAVNHLADIGGDMRAGGRNASDRPWQVGVEVPAVGRRGAVHTVVGLEDAAVTTSGDYRNFFMHGGVRYSHTIHPRTGWPVVQEVASVSVIDPTSMRSDGLATAMMVLGPEAGMDLAREHSIPVLFILYSDEGLLELASPEFAAFQARADARGDS